MPVTELPRVGDLLQFIDDGQPIRVWCSCCIGAIDIPGGSKIVVTQVEDRNVVEPEYYIVRFNFWGQHHFAGTWSKTSKIDAALWEALEPL